MNQTIELSEIAYQALVNAARASRKTVDALILESFPPISPQVTEEERQRANARLRQHIVSLGYPAGSDNAQIDADLAQAYANEHNA